MSADYTYDVHLDSDDGRVTVTRWEPEPGRPPGWQQVAGEQSIDVQDLFVLLAERGE